MSGVAYLGQERRQEEVSQGARQCSIAASYALIGRSCAQLARKIAHLALAVDGLDVGRARRPDDYGVVQEDMVGCESRLASIVKAG